MKSLEGKMRHGLYDAVLAESERLADQFLATTKEIAEALDPLRLIEMVPMFDSPFCVYLYEMVGSLHPEKLIHDVRPYLPHFSLRSTGTRRAYDVHPHSGLPGSGTYGPHAFDEALRRATDEFIRARDEAAFAIAEKFQIYPDAASHIRSALHSLGCLRNEDASPSTDGHERTLAAHVSIMLQPILFPPTVTFTRGADGAVTISIPRDAIIPENLAKLVRRFRDTGDHAALVTGNDVDAERVMKRRDQYHLDYILWGKLKPTADVDTIRKGLRDYSRSWGLACGGEGLPRLRESVTSPYYRHHITDNLLVPSSSKGDKTSP